MKKFEDDPNTKTDNILALAEAFFPYFCVSIGFLGTTIAMLAPGLSFELRLLAITTTSGSTILGASITDPHRSRSQYMSRKPPTINNISALNYSEESTEDDIPGNPINDKHDQF